MDIIEKPLIVNGAKIGTFQAYENIEPEFIANERGVRVLPAPYFYERDLHFILIRRWEPNEKPSFPNGGYEVRAEEGGIRSFDLDQVIIHPSVLKHKETLDKMSRKMEKAEALENKRLARGEKPLVVKTGKRGRKPLSEEERQLRLDTKESNKIKSGNKRGRPVSGTRKEPKAPTGGKRGRKSLSPEVKAQRLADKAAKSLLTGGKRGRPAKIK